MCLNFQPESVLPISQLGPLISIRERNNTVLIRPLQARWTALRRKVKHHVRTGRFRRNRNLVPWVPTIAQRDDKSGPFLANDAVSVRMVRVAVDARDAGRLSPDVSIGVGYLALLLDGPDDILWSALHAEIDGEEGS